MENIVVIVHFRSDVARIMLLPDFMLKLFSLLYLQLCSDKSVTHKIPIYFGSACYQLNHIGVYVVF
jgi:hypothetical protein